MGVTASNRKIPKRFLSESDAVQAMSLRTFFETAGLRVTERAKQSRGTTSHSITDARSPVWGIFGRASRRHCLNGVGYLEAGKDYPRGEASELVFERLVGLVKRSGITWFGYHDCDLDLCGSPQPPPELRYKGLVIPTQCDRDILVPGETVIYIAPALILHYIRAHNYQPPSAFLKAVVACPEPTSTEYLAELEKICPPTANSW